MKKVLLEMKMNKYQEALNKIVKSSCPNCIDNNGCSSCDIQKNCNCQAKSWVDTLQELVNKETPKNPIIQGCQVTIHYCPNCKKELIVTNDGIVIYKTKTNYCDECGQKLDWSDEDEL